MKELKLCCINKFFQNQLATRKVGDTRGEQLKKLTVEVKKYEDMYKQKCDEVDELFASMQHYQIELKTVRDLLDSVVKENQLLKKAQWKQFETLPRKMSNS